MKRQALLLTSMLISTNIYAQDTLDCTVPDTELLIYCNDFNTGASSDPGIHPEFHDLGAQGYNTFFAGTEVKDPLVTVQGSQAPAAIAQQESVEVVKLNIDNYISNDQSNLYTIGMAVNIETNPLGSDVFAFSFDVTDPVTGNPYPFIDLQFDSAPAFLSNLDGSLYTIGYPAPVFSPMISVFLADGLQEADVMRPNGSLGFGLTPTSPEILYRSPLIMGGEPLPAGSEPAQPNQGYQLDFKRSTVRIPTTGITNPNNTVTVLLTLDNDAYIQTNTVDGHYALFDNIKVKAISDSDNDGIPDSVEGTADADGDGIFDIFESNTIDTDGDGTPDYMDTDADGDGILDATEQAGVFKRYN